MRRRGAALTTALLAALTLGACSSGSAGGTSNGAAIERQGAPIAGTEAPSPATGPGGRTSGSGVTSGTGDATALADASAVIRTAEMTVSITGASHVAAKADAAGTIAVAAGGEIDADDRTSGKYASATLRLRVPPEQLQPVLSKLSRLGAEKSRRLSTTDVTERVADVTSRVNSARDAIARLRTLYGRATKVADVISVESELSTREADLESLEAQQRALARATGLATISLTLQTAARHAPPPPHKKGHTGFVGGLRDGWHGFVSAAGWVAQAVGTVLPFVLLLLLVAVAARLLWTRRPNRPAPPTPTSE